MFKMKGNTIMKALRYLLMVIAMVSWMGISAQTLAQHPIVEMRSTSVMAGSGSNLPMAAQCGVTMAYAPTATPTTYNAPSGPRKIGGNTSGGSGGREDPYETPLGDGAWPMAILACAYLILRAARRRTRESIV